MVNADTDAVSELRVASCGANVAVVCYRSRSGSGTRHSAAQPYPGICTPVHLNGTLLSKGPDLTFGSVSLDGLSLQSLSETTTLACYNPEWSSYLGVKCTAFNLIGTQLMKVADVVVDSTLYGATHIQITRYSTDAVVVCYRSSRSSSNNQNIGICKEVALRNSALTGGFFAGLGFIVPGRDVILGSVSASGISMASFAVTIGVACYNPNPSQSIQVVCNCIHASQTGLLKGDDVVVDASTSGATEIRVAKLSETLGIVCYRSGQYSIRQPYPAKCVQLRLNGTALSKDPDLVLVLASVSSSGIRLEAFSGDLAVACYTPFHSKNGGLVCNTLEVSDKWLVRGPDIIVDSSSMSMSHVSVRSISPRLGVVCYRRENTTSDPPNPGVCTHIHLRSSMAEDSTTPGQVIGSVAPSGVAMASLSANKTLICYSHGAHSLGLTCNVMWARGESFSTTIAATSDATASTTVVTSTSSFLTPDSDVSTTLSAATGTATPRHSYRYYLPHVSRCLHLQTTLVLTMAISVSTVLVTGSLEAR